MPVRIEGVSDVLRMFDDAPKDLLNAAKKAMRSACNVEKRNLKRSVPAEARQLVKSKVKSTRAGDVIARFGMFMDGTRTADDADNMRWFHFYWKNYGTLSHRDPSHQFMYPIKNIRTRRNNVGQEHENFYEAAVSGYETRFVENFKKSLKDQGYEIE